MCKKQKIEVLLLLQNGIRRAEIALGCDCSDKLVPVVAAKNYELEVRKKPTGFDGTTRSDKSAISPMYMCAATNASVQRLRLLLGLNHTCSWVRFTRCLPLVMLSLVGSVSDALIH